MSSNLKLKTQVAIFGGGVAGLWLLNRLRQLNIQCVLIESHQLGCGQSIYSQGIIHSGVKYALQGKLTVSAQAMKDMPDVWHQCFRGEGEIDLSSVTILSEYQYMWSPGSLAANLAVFLASKNVKSQVSCLTKEDYPEVFSTPNFKGVVYRLEEPVLAVKTLIEALVAPCRENILHAQLQKIENSTLYLNNASEEIELEAEQIILLAGKGNQELAQKLGLTLPKMQLRPLLMVAVSQANLPKLFAHAMQVSDKPRLTITTHSNGESDVWYLGGDLAEMGVNRSSEEQIAFARKELTILFPHIDFSAAKFETFYIERAEADYASGKKPDGPSMIVEKNVITAWPTKLAFAPLLAQQIIDQLSQWGVEGRPSVAPASMPSLTFMMPAIANYPWEHPE